MLETENPEGADVVYPFTFRWTKRIEKIFIRSNIFLKHPFRIRNIYKVGDEATIKGRVLVEPYATISGRNSFMNCSAFTYLHTNFGPDAYFGRYCSIAPYSRIMGSEHPLDRISTHPFTCREYFRSRMLQDFGGHPDFPPFEDTKRGPMIVQDDVWIGNSTLIRPGVTIGYGAVVAAGSVVTKDVPPFAIVGGNPARIVRYRFDEKTIERILKVAWWRYHVADFSGLDASDVHQFLDGLEARIERGEIAPYTPEKIDLGAKIHALLQRQQVREKKLARLVSATRIDKGNDQGRIADTPESRKEKETYDTSTNEKIIASLIEAGTNDFSTSPFHEMKGDIARNLIAEAAERRGFIVEIERGRTYRLLKDRIESVFRQNAPDVGIPSTRITRDKHLTKTMLAQAGIAVPHGQVFDNEERALSYFRSRSTAQVVKPLAGEGGYHVTAGITDEATFSVAWRRTAAHSRKIVVEDFVAGDEIRVILIGDEVVAAVCRVPAYVIGDGVHTVKVHAEQKNRERMSNPLLRRYPIKGFDQLEIDRRKLSDIPGPGERVRLSTVSNIALGGESVSVIDVLHPSILEFARKTASAIADATLLGLDIIVKNFLAEADGNACILEVNSNPAIATPYFAAYGKPAASLPDRILDFVVERADAARPSAPQGRASIEPARAFEPACGGASFPRTYASHVRLIRQAAYAHNLKVQALNSEITLISSQSGHTVFYQGMPAQTRLVSRLASNDKEWTKKLLQRADVRTPAGKAFSAESGQEAWTFAQLLNVPVVVKPLRGSGGKGVTSDISTSAHFSSAWKNARATGTKSIVVEEHLEGNDYRVLVIGNTVCAASQRIPAYIVGDGVHTIEQLIAIRNEQRKSNPYEGAKAIKITSMILRNLEELGLDKGSILPADRYLQLHKIANIGSGGESRDVTEIVHPGFAEIGVRARKALYDPLHVGYDLIAEDISKSPDDQQWAIIEVNSNPDWGIHHFAGHGTSRDAAGALIETLFPETRSEPPRMSASISITPARKTAKLLNRLWRRAHLRALLGWVRMQPDGEVEMVVYGTPNAVDDMVRTCVSGPRDNERNKVTVSEYEGEIPEGFSVVA